MSCAHEFMGRKNLLSPIHGFNSLVNLSLSCLGRLVYECLQWVGSSRPPRAAIGQKRTLPRLDFEVFEAPTKPGVDH